MKIKSIWIKSTIILIPGICLILINYLLEYYGFKNKIYGFNNIYIPFSIGFSALFIYIFANYSENGSKMFFTMIFYLIFTAILCFVLLYYDLLHGDLVLLFAFHNILIVVLLIVVLFHSN